jgi:hypothetical protein
LLQIGAPELSVFSKRCPPKEPSMKKFRKGTDVTWAWGAHRGEGKVPESFTHDIVRTIKGTKVKRTASADEPAYLIEQADGGHALKSHSELCELIDL